MPYNKQLTNLACSSRTVEYWPSVIFVRTSLRSIRTVTTSVQYSPVRPSRSVSKRLVRNHGKITTKNKNNNNNYSNNKNNNNNNNWTLLRASKRFHFHKCHSDTCRVYSVYHQMILLNNGEPVGGERVKRCEGSCEKEVMHIISQ